VQKARTEKQTAPAVVAAHGRYVTFQMAEVAVPRDLYRDILELID
jgi:hypothetical protein